MSEKTSNPMLSAILPPFDELVAQPLVARFLSSVIHEQKSNHAYLLVGPLGSGKNEAAMLLARALICANKGCSACDECVRVKHGTHPDLHIIDPLGANGYLAEQMQELLHDVSLAPMRAKHKVYLITRADLLRGVPANALLKTLEEPPASVTFILLARTRDAVLTTILTRCQVVALRRVPEEDAIKIVCEHSGEKATKARMALSVTGGSVYRALDFLHSKSRLDMRIKVINILEELSKYDDLEVLDAVRDLMTSLKQPLDAVKLEQEQQLKVSKDYLAKGAITRLEQQHKREFTNRERETIGEVLDVMRSWLRDALMVAANYSLCAEEASSVGSAFATGDSASAATDTTANYATAALDTAASDSATAVLDTTASDSAATVGVKDVLDIIVNCDFHYQIGQTAARVGIRPLVAALNAIDAAQEQMQYNVASQLALESLFFKVRGALQARQ
ncbi:MAG: DNA polymerase III subunit delta' [Coriobacteriales bacterium]|jgi:DNA polymerase-3 subunit delta'|nr:DNA polymerase III subunit delta' [Coriobacteriales bacterium]